MANLLDGRSSSGEFPDWEAERLIGVFSAGYRVTVSRRHPGPEQRRRGTGPDLEQLVGFDEAWVLCPRRPPPGWRILGRFYDRDVFVALFARPKHLIVGRYPEAVERLQRDWVDIFGDQPPHRGVEIADYLSGVYRDADEDA